MFTCGADIYLRCYRLHGGCGFEYTSGGSCGRACIIPPKILGHLPPVGQRYLCLTAWGVYLRWFRLHSAGVSLSIPPVAPADVPALFRPRVGDIYLWWGRDVYLRCFWCLPPVVSPTLGGSKFEYTSGGSCGRACNTRPRFGTSTCGATRLFENRAKFPLRCNV